MSSYTSSIRKAYNNGRSLVKDETKERLKPYAFALILVATGLDNLNVSGTMTSYFSILSQFDSPSTVATWVLSAYSLTLGAFIIISGKLADVFGPENVFVVGLFLTSISALICAVIEDSIIVLIIFRAIQGMAASSLIPSAFAFVGGFFKGKGLEIALSLMIVSVTAVLGLGLIFGGAFSESNIGYKGLYYFTFALSFVISIILYFFCPDVPKTEGHRMLKAKNLDYMGSIFLVIGLLLIILGLTEGGESWKKPASYVPIPVGFVIVALVMVYEMVYIQRYKDKYHQVNDQSNSEEKESVEETSIKVNDWRVDLELLFPREAFSIPNIYQFLCGIALSYITFISAMALMVQYYQYIELNSPILAAVKVLPMAFGLSFGAAVYRESIAHKIGTSVCCVISPLIQLGMSVWLSRLDPDTKNSYWKYEFISQFIFGYGTNLYFQVYLNAVISGCPEHLLGVVSGILQTTGQIGICLGNAIVATILGELLLKDDKDYRMDLRKRFDKCFYMVFASASLMVLIMLTLKRVKKKSDGSSS